MMNEYSTMPSIHASKTVSRSAMWGRRIALAAIVALYASLV